MGKLYVNKVQTLDGEKFSIRTALPQDAERIIAYNKAVMGEALYLVTTEAEFTVTKEQLQSLLKQSYEDEGKLAILAEYGGEVIGFLDFQNGNKLRTRHQGSFGMSVKESYRNQGVGKALLESLIEWAEGNPLIEKICLEVFADNEGAIKLYRKYGFVEEGVKRKGIRKSDGSYHDLILMALFME